ncbi:hypothetical protein BDR06DRAFT_864240, partial [Suillus hirtellus]
MVTEEPYEAHITESIEKNEATGHIDREILETLWAPFNKISPTARSMTLSHRKEKWKKQAELAALDRGELLDIYQLKMDKAPTMAEIRLRLTENELSSHGRTGAILWLIEGINIENTQDTLRSSIRQQSDNLTASQRIIIEEKRQKLLSWIHKFHKTMMVITNSMELEGRERLQHDDPEL